MSADTGHSDHSPTDGGGAEDGGRLVSMTGFGRGSAAVAGRRVTVEIRAVNHRFLDLKVRLPWSSPLVEQRVGQRVRKALHRGAVTVLVKDLGGSDGPAPVQVDLALAQGYVAALESLREACGLPPSDAASRPSLAMIAALPGVLAAGGDPADGEALWGALGPAVDEALTELVDSRLREGEALAADLRGRAASLRALGVELARLAEGAPDAARQRLEERLRRLLDGGEVDPQRLAQEVALIADRTDIAEEITRLGAHLDELERLLASDGPSGRRLDFLAQEMHREVNTIGSKAQLVELSSLVLEAKAEVERLREQAQNVE